MKKLLIIMSVFLLTGCFENSGYITKSCTKEEIANTLNSKTVYTFKFKNDIVSELDVMYEYHDDNESIISSLKTSYETQNYFLNLKYDVLENNANNYKIKYYIPLENNDEFKDKFIIKNSRTDLVNDLKNNGYICE